MTALEALAGRSLAVRFEQDEALVAGLRVGIGAIVLEVDLAEELTFFAERIHAD